MQLKEITPLVLTFNEESNIDACLKALHWASNIVIVDSGSTDRTVEIAKAFESVRVYTRPFDNHTAQWNFGLEKIHTPWVLTLDADYVCPESLPHELSRLSDESALYQARFRYGVFGYPLRKALYPPRVVLFPSHQYRYLQDGHTQLLDTQGHTTRFLTSVFDHDDRKPLGRWLDSQSKYASLEAKKLHAAVQLGWKDRIRKKIILAPLLTLFYCLFWQGLIWDGWRGMHYTIQRVYAELLLSLYLLDRKLRDR